MPSPGFGGGKPRTHERDFCPPQPRCHLKNCSREWSTRILGSRIGPAWYHLPRDCQMTYNGSSLFSTNFCHETMEMGLYVWRLAQMRILHLQYIDSLISLMAGCTRRSMLGAIRTAEALRAFYAVSDSIIYSVRIVWNKRAWTQVNGYDQIVRKSSIITSSKSYQPMCLIRWP